MERTEGEILSGTPVEVVMGGRSFKITPLARKQSRKYLPAMIEVVERLAECLDLYTVLKGAVEVSDLVQKWREIRGLNIDELIPKVLAFLKGGLHEALDLVYLYSAELEAEREWLEDNATDAEFLTALIECVRMYFAPFGRVLLSEKVVRTVTNIRSRTEP